MNGSLFTQDTVEAKIKDLELLYTCITDYKEGLSKSKITIKNVATIDKLEDWRGKIYSTILYLKKENGE